MRTSDATGPWARFDDLRTGTAMRFPAPRRVHVAARIEDVPTVLAEVEQATAAGSWAFGYVAYEAAAGLDPSLPVALLSEGDPPPAWFGLCAPRRRCPRFGAPLAAAPRTAGRRTGPTTSTPGPWPRSGSTSPRA
jgi:para-aminobenzoate synthetase/4-amino-4-deoxychorismate lyase